MNIPDLIKAAEAGFTQTALDSKAEGIEISSGGSDVLGDANLRTEPAALYATEALALEAWLTEFNRVAWLTNEPRGAQTLTWIEKPYVETYRITLGDSYGTFRVVRDRYVARGRVAISSSIEDGVALMNAAHPEGPGAAEDMPGINPDSIVTVEMDEEQLKPAGKPLKIGRKAKAA